MSAPAARWITGKLALAAALALSAAPNTRAATGPDLNSILSHHAQARGGRDAWKGVQALEIHGNLISFSEPSPFVLMRQRPNRYRMEMTKLKHPVVEVFDGSRAWCINGLMGTEWPLAAPEPAAGDIAREADFDSPLLGYPANGHTLSASGPEDFEGRPALKIDVTLNGGGKETWYLDPATWLEVARFSTTSDFGEVMEKRSWFSDFRRVGGVVIPHRIETEYGTRAETFEIAEVRVNPPIDAARFVQPLPEGMDFLAAMAGSWELTIETRVSPRAPWQPHQATAEIRPRLEKGLLEETYSHVDQGQGVEGLRLWSFDRFYKVYRVVQSDSVAFQQTVLQGAVADGKLTVSNEGTGSSWKTPDEEILTRLVLHDLQPGSFQVDTESSRDAGKTWNTDQKVTYKKR